MAQETGEKKSHDCSGQYMFIMDKYYRQFLRDSLKPYDLTATEGMALLSLYRYHTQEPSEEGYTQEELNNELHYDKAALTRAMKLLEEKNMVLRKPNHRDKRSSCFFMTEAGLAMLPIILGILVKWESEIFAGVGDEEKKAFSATIMKVADNAGKAARRYRLETNKEMD